MPLSTLKLLFLAVTEMHVYTLPLQGVQVMFGMGFVCLSVCTSHVWHGVCLFVHVYKLCLAWGLSVCPCVQVMFGMGFVCLSIAD